MSIETSSSSSVRANNKEQKYFYVIYVEAFEEKTSLAINKTNITSIRKTTNKIRVKDIRCEKRDRKTELSKKITNDK